MAEIYMHILYLYPTLHHVCTVNCTIHLQIGRICSISACVSYLNSKVMFIDEIKILLSQTH
jgi:hypothetical protein